jgi:serine/threonine protein kinase
VSASFAEGLVGITLDERYRLDAVLGEGGMGAVFRATHVAMERRVAVKLLKPHLTSDEVSLQRFAREARSTMKVDSPHAVKVLDFGVTPHRDYYIVLEYLDGRTVQRELEIDGPFAPSRVVHIARQALHALAAAHQTGLVHRDIKPDNILLMRAGADPDYTKLLDFGVAKLMEGAAQSADSQLALTQVGTVFGTPEFMSPEQACGHALDGRSDLYSLAATMFVMLTGCGLFDAGSAIEWLTSHVRTPPPHLADARPELAAYPELDAVLQRCLAKHRDSRPRSAAELDALLARLEPALARPTSSLVGRAASTGPRVFSASMFFEALPRDAVNPGALTPSATGVTPQVESSTRDLLAVVRPRRRGLYLGLGALGTLGAAATALGIALASRASSPATPDTSAVALAPADAAAVGSDVPSLDAAIAEVTDAAVVLEDAPSTTRISSTRSASSSRHLRAAEDAFRTGKLMKQLAEADLALREDPRNARAKYLLGDALIKYGDLARGCAYLRTLGRNALAVARANAAGCP